MKWRNPGWKKTFPLFYSIFKNYINKYYLLYYFKQETSKITKKSKNIKKSFCVNLVYDENKIISRQIIKN